MIIKKVQIVLENKAYRTTPGPTQRGLHRSSVLKTALKIISVGHWKKRNKRKLVIILRGFTGRFYYMYIPV